MRSLPLSHLFVSVVPSSSPQPAGVLTAELRCPQAGKGGAAGAGDKGGLCVQAGVRDGGKSPESRSGGARPLHPQPGREDGTVQPAGSASDQGDPHQGGHAPAQGQRSLPDAAHHTGRYGAGRGGAGECTIHPVEL